MKTTLAVKGVEQLQARLRKLQGEAPREFARALRQEGEALMTMAKEQTPVAPSVPGRHIGGTLRNSGYVEAPFIRPNGEITIKVGFSAWYAVYVHEKTWARHTVGKAKFLSDPLQERMVDFEKRMIVRVRQMLAQQKAATP